MNVVSFLRSLYMKAVLCTAKYTCDRYQVIIVCGPEGVVSKSGFKVIQYVTVSVMDMSDLNQYTLPYMSTFFRSQPYVGRLTSLLSIDVIVS